MESSILRLLLFLWVLAPVFRCSHRLKGPVTPLDMKNVEQVRLYLEQLENYSKSRQDNDKSKHNEDVKQTQQSFM